MGAFWYTALAPAGNDGSSGGSVQVVLSATSSGSGAWQRYLLTVKNVADGDFNGEALLIDAEDAGQPASRSPKIPNQVPNLNNASSLPLAEVDDARILTGALQNAFPLGGKPLEQEGRVLVATVLRPEQGEDRELEMVRVASEQLADAVELLVGQPQCAVERLFRRDLRQGPECSREARQASARFHLL